MQHYSTRKSEVWEKGRRIKGKDPRFYRKDKCGNVMYYHSHGKNTPKGWTIDHSKPISKGGTDHLNNLQPLNSSTNRKKSDQYPYSCPAKKKSRKKEESFPWGAAAIGLLTILALKK